MTRQEIMANAALTKLIRDAIESALAAGHVVQKSWIAHSVLRSQGNIEGEGVAFYTACAYHATVRIAGDVIRSHGKQEREEAEAEQQRLPGFEYVRTAYSVVRQKEPCIIPIEQMTRKEILEKAAELRAFAAGALAHADELEEYAKTLAPVA